MLAQEPPGDVETKKIVVRCPKPCLQQGSEHQMEDVGSCEVPGPPSLGYSLVYGRSAEQLPVEAEQWRGSDVTRGVRFHGEAARDLVDHVDYKDDVGETQGDELHQPEAEERDGGEEIEANVGAAGLNGVAHKSLLLVLIEWITSKEEDEDTEEDHHNEPHLP